MELSESGQSKNNFFLARMEILIPLFAGVLCAMFLCAITGGIWGVYKIPAQPQAVVEVEREEDEGNFLLAAIEYFKDPVLEYYRNPEYAEWVINFFTGICSSREVVLAILDNADKFDVPPALAFALSWEESGFNPAAINRYNLDGSVDRGLFQLNNRSFPNLETSVFFDVNSNAYYGISHLRFCLDSGGSEVSALAMYNAGTGRVRTSGAPAVTLNYISRILENRSRIESRFHARLIKEEENRLAEAALAEDEEIVLQPSYFSRTLITAFPL